MLFKAKEKSQKHPKWIVAARSGMDWNAWVAANKEVKHGIKSNFRRLSE